MTTPDDYTAHAWRPQRVPPPPPAAGPPGDAEFEFIGQCNPLI